MPTYLCHGFRWQRQSIRVHVILQDLDDASPEWIIPAKSSHCILNSFYELFNFLPDCSPERGRRYSSIGGTDSDYDDRTLSYARGRNPSRGRSQSQSTHQTRSRSRATQQQQQQPIPPLPASNVGPDSTLFDASDDEFEAQSWSAIKLLEEYDPRDLTTVSRPYAYVADYAIRIDLSCSIVDEIAKYEQQQLQSGYPAVSISAGDSPTRGPGWFEQLRDELQRGEEIRWYVVVNNDEAREWASESPESESAPRLDLNLRRQQYQQYQQSRVHSSEYQTQQGRPTSSKKQIQLHTQYPHQQIIFDRETEQAQDRSQSQPGTGQEAKDEQQPPQSASKTKAYQQQEFDLGVQQQQLILEKSRQQRRREKEHEQQLHMGKISKQDGKTGEKQRLERNPRPPPLMNGADAGGPPPMVPEKDHQYPLLPTAKSKGNTTTAPLRPELSIDTGGAKSSGKKGGRLRRFFSRTRLQASGESSP